MTGSLCGKCLKDNWRDQRNIPDARRTSRFSPRQNLSGIRYHESREKRAQRRFIDRGMLHPVSASDVPFHNRDSRRCEAQKSRQDTQERHLLDRVSFEALRKSIQLLFPTHSSILLRFVSPLLISPSIHISFAHLRVSGWSSTQIMEGVFIVFSIKDCLVDLSAFFHAEDFWQRPL
jgi:hypothetical protein